ncbi:unnamed protein product [Closterium sp. NIES-54]
MASLSVLTFNHEGCAIQFDTWLDDLQLYLLSDSRDNVSLFNHTSGASLAPPSTADSATRSHWLTRDAAACLAVRNHLPNELTSDSTRLLKHWTTDLTVDLLKKHLLAAETSVVAVGAAHGTPRTPFFEGWSPSPLAPSYASASAADILGAEDVGDASAIGGKRRSSKGKGGRSGGGGSRGGGGGGSGGGDSGGGGGESGGFGGGSGGGSWGGGRGNSGSGDGRGGAVQQGGSSGGPRQQQQRRSETPSPQQLREWFTQCGASGGRRLLSLILIIRNSTTLTPLSALVLVRLADTSGGPVLARSSNVLLYPAVPSDSLSALHLPSFSTNLVSTAALQDAMVTTTTPGGQRVSICTCTRTGRHLATFTRRPGSSLDTLATEPPQVAASAQVSTSGPVAPPCSCRLLSHQTLLLHHRLGHPSLPRLHGVHSRLLVFVCLQLRERFRQDLPVLRLHSDRGGEFSFDLLREFCRGEGILQSFTLPASPQQNGIAERRIGLVMEVARTSRIHAAAPHFMWSFAVLYAAHLLNLLPHVSLSETSPTLRWMGKVGDASVFRVWGSRAFVHDSSTDKLSPRAIPCVFLGFPPDAPGLQFYHPTSRRVLPSQDVTFDKSVPFYRLFPYHTAPLPPPPPLFLAPSPPPVDPLPLQGPAPSGVSQVDPLPGTVPVKVVVDSGAARGAASGGAAYRGAAPGGAASGGARPASAEPGDAEPEVAEPRGAESEGVEFGGAEPGGCGVWGC